MTIQHTPGPWTLSQDPSRIYVRTSKTTSYVFKLDDDANARLIAAAPELLQIAKDYVLLCELHDMEGAVLDAARAAIAKAKGNA